MRYLFLAAVLVFATAGPARADDGLTTAVAATYGTRTPDASLHAIAHERVMEITCDGCMTHDGMQSGTAEVLGYNAGFADPIAAVVAAWGRSTGHDQILSDPDYGRIGCAETVAGDRHYFVCVLATGGSFTPPPQQASPTPQPEVLGGLPDTAMR